MQFELWMFESHQWDCHIFLICSISENWELQSPSLTFAKKHVAEPTDVYQHSNDCIGTRILAYLHRCVHPPKFTFDKDTVTTTDIAYLHYRSVQLERNKCACTRCAIIFKEWETIEQKTGIFICSLWRRVRNSHTWSVYRLRMSTICLSLCATHVFYCPFGNPLNFRFHFQHTHKIEYTKRKGKWMMKPRKEESENTSPSIFFLSSAECDQHSYQHSHICSHPIIPRYKHASSV